MKACFIIDHGSPDVIQYGDKPEPNCINSNDVKVKIHYAGLNNSDVALRTGSVFYAKIKGYHILGIDYTGEVIASKSSRFKIGDTVCGLVSPVKGGGHAEYIVVPDSHLLLIPHNIDEKQVAAMLTPLATAIQIRDMLSVNHKKILMNGCSGAVGKSLCQILIPEKKEVYGIASARQMESLKNMGVKQVFDYKKNVPYENYKPFDAVIDCNGNLGYGVIRKWIRPGGKFIAINIKDGLMSVLRNYIQSFFSSKRYRFTYVRPTSQSFQKFIDTLQHYRVKLDIIAEYPLERAKEAHQKIETEKLDGRIIFKISNH